ncbi:hypothetical protein DPMN_172586 [Dreissena polymorpha]|uniref:Uncharacterized protein n=1 Tax=Dreissena polymorpha TaxID=45954 RepID=A0A9D4IGR4_DREPO|nr:hypothetical protein DPMN_172586 [Dreissena polymorpha]
MAEAGRSFKSGLMAVRIFIGNSVTMKTVLDLSTRNTGWVLNTFTRLHLAVPTNSVWTLYVRTEARDTMCTRALVFSLERTTH